METRRSKAQRRCRTPATARWVVLSCCQTSPCWARPQPHHKPVIHKSLRRKMLGIVIALMCQVDEKLP
jgi:hypothetical protein